MAASPIILGINSVYHESSACLLKGAHVLAFGEQERFNRVKKGKRARVDNADELPIEAIRHCLDQAGVHWGQIDRVAVSFDPSLRRAHPDEAVTHADWGSAAGEEIFLRKVRHLPSRLSELAGMDLRNRWSWVPHERAHAASAYFASPFDEAAVLSVDGIGESSTTLLAHGCGTELRDLDTLYYPNSVGFLWEKVCKFLGFSEYDAGKLMALAAFADPSDLAGPLAELVFRSDWSFEVALDDLRFRVDDYGPLERRFGKRRMPGDTVSPRDAALAAALQQTTEEILFGLVDRLRKKTGSNNLCLAGGVMMNCVALGRLLGRGPFEEVFVQPIAHDSGTALGAAFAALYAETECSDRWVMRSPYLGADNSSQTIEHALLASGLPFVRTTNAARTAAHAIANGKIIGWFQGASEAGPRALGNRSILADPRRAASKELINLKVKHREYFRPFAPSVLSEHAASWFEIPRDSPSLRFMSFAFPVREDKRSEVPAIVHVDGTARPQVVDEPLNPTYHELIREFHALTGVPLVLNTSFNTDDEPIVNSPADAVRTLLRTDLDLLFMGDFVVENPRRARGGYEEAPSTSTAALADMA
jgi:carbamoyltransferase